MKLIISNIEWDDSTNNDLPNQVIVDDPKVLPYLLENIDTDKQNIEEWLTRTYECCVIGFVPEVKGGD